MCLAQPQALLCPQQATCWHSSGCCPDSLPSFQVRTGILSITCSAPLEPKQGHSLWSEGVSGRPSRDPGLRQGHFSAAQGIHPHPSLLPSHTLRQILFISSCRTSPQWGMNFIFHLVATALILGLNQCKFRQALEKTLFLLPLISPATSCQPYR